MRCTTTRVTILAVALAALCGAAAVSGADIAWTGAADDNFANAANWSPAQVPGAADTVMLGRGDRVRVSANQQIGTLLLPNARGSGVNPIDPDAAVKVYADAAEQNHFAISTAFLNVTMPLIDFSGVWLAVTHDAVLYDTVLYAGKFVIAQGVTAPQAVTVYGLCVINADVQVDGRLYIAHTGMTGDVSTLHVGNNTYIQSASGVLEFAPSAGDATLFSHDGQALVSLAGTVTMTDAQQFIRLSAVVPQDWVNSDEVWVISATFTGGSSNPNGGRLVLHGVGSGRLSSTTLPPVVQLSDGRETPDSHPLLTLVPNANGYAFGTLRQWPGRVEMPSPVSIKVWDVTSGMRFGAPRSIIGFQDSSNARQLTIETARISRRAGFDGVAVTITKKMELSSTLWVDLNSVLTFAAESDSTFARGAAMQTGALSVTVNFDGRMNFTNDNGLNGATVSNGPIALINVQPMATCTFSSAILVQEHVNVLVWCQGAGQSIFESTAKVNIIGDDSKWRVYGANIHSGAEFSGAGLLSLRAPIAYRAVPTVVPEQLEFWTNGVSHSVDVLLVGATVRTLSLGSVTIDVANSLTVTDTLSMWLGIPNAEDQPVDTAQPRAGVRRQGGCAAMGSGDVAAVPVTVSRINAATSAALSSEFMGVNMRVTGACNITSHIGLSCGAALNIASTDRGYCLLGNELTAPEMTAYPITIGKNVTSPNAGGRQLPVGMTIGASARLVVAVDTAVAVGAYNEPAESLGWFNASGTVEVRFNKTLTIVAPTCLTLLPGGTITGAAPVYDATRCGALTQTPQINAAFGTAAPLPSIVTTLALLLVSLLVR